MCGITGCISVSKISTNCVIKSLNRLQNRGYDSTGISVILNNQIITKKYISDSNKPASHFLNSDSELNSLKSAIAIGHTRWATHGKISIQNAHPHNSKNISVIHNGIIENHAELKLFLSNLSYDFHSETDSEVVANYLAYMSEANIDFSNLNNILKGSWSVLFINQTEPDRIYFMKNGSPLLIGYTQTKNKIMAVSETTGFDSDIVKYYPLDDGEFGYISVGKISSINNYPEYDFSYTHTDHNSYPHWTIKEILDQPVAIDNLLQNRLDIEKKIISFPELDLIQDDLSKAEHLIFLGCGTSLHAAKFGSYYFQEFGSDKTIDIIDGSDFEIMMIPPNRKTILILLSQSGETKDLCRALDIGKKLRMISIGIVNVENSLLAREVTTCLYLKAGKENAVASTKCFTNQVVMLLILALWMGPNSDKRNTYITDLAKLSADYAQIIRKSLAECVPMIKFFKNVSSCFILGKHQAEVTANEAALKIKEISYIHAEGFGTSSLKHGPFALLTKQTPVIMIVPEDNFQEKNHNAAHEIKSRSAKIIYVTNTSMPANIIDYALHYETDSVLFPLMAVVPLQILAYELSLDRGINPDYPRNLAKVVTVE